MNSFDDIFENMKMHGIKIPEKRLQISIPNANVAIEGILKKILMSENKQLKWIQAYDCVSDWLMDNKGMGLFMYGNCGLGKSLLGRYVIPAILLQYAGKVTSVYDMNVLNSKIDEALTKKIISLDDVGTEEISIKFGEKRMAFAEIIDNAEKYGNLVIATSNLGIDDLRQRYGDRVVERIKSTTKRVLFTGKSFR